MPTARAGVRPALVNTTRTGLGAKAGHDLTIEVTRWHGHATVDTAVPANSSVTIQVDVGSFKSGKEPVASSHSPAPTAQIHKTLRQILHRPTTITFRSSRVDGSAASFACDGELTIMGVTHPVALQGRVTDGRVVGGGGVVQSRWGIRPYSAFFGALRLRDEVKVDFDLASPQTVDGAWPVLARSSTLLS